MSCNCKKKSCPDCSGSGNNLAQLQNQVSALQDTLDQLSSAAKFLTCGHPILMLENEDDINAFDDTSGEGSDCWQGWALCIGKTHKTTSGKKITTPNLVDRFVVMANGNYSVGDTGGSDTVALITNNLPAHNHPVNDPGHNHSVNDAGHDHGVTDPGHHHTAGAHTHTFTTGESGNHTHDVAVGNQGAGDRSGGDTSTATSGTTTFTTTAGGNHTHSGTTDSAGGGATGDAFTGIDINPAYTGITNNTNTTGITTGNTGSGTAHENRPPFYALIFVMKIG